MLKWTIEKQRELETIYKAARTNQLRACGGSGKDEKFWILESIDGWSTDVKERENKDSENFSIPGYNLDSYEDNAINTYTFPYIDDAFLSLGFFWHKAF